MQFPPADLHSLLSVPALGALGCGPAAQAARINDPGNVGLGSSAHMWISLNEERAGQTLGGRKQKGSTLVLLAVFLPFL